LYHQAIVAVDDTGDRDTLKLAADRTLREYAEAVRAERGWTEGPKLAGSLAAEIAAVVGE
jgi:hypothetical protein